MSAFAPLVGLSGHRSARLVLRGTIMRLKLLTAAAALALMIGHSAAKADEEVGDVVGERAAH
jgi:hypothetical protein